MIRFGVLVANGGRSHKSTVEKATGRERREEGRDGEPSPVGFAQGLLQVDDEDEDHRIGTWGGRRAREMIRSCDWDDLMMMEGLIGSRLVIGFRLGERERVLTNKNGGFPQAKSPFDLMRVSAAD